MISASQKYFGSDECPGKPDEEMSLEVKYRCNAGGGDHSWMEREVGKSNCPGSKSEKPALSNAAEAEAGSGSAKTKSQQCKDKSLGRRKSKEALGCGGSVDLHCKGGCLNIQQVSYTCSEQLKDKPDQKKLVMAKCEEKEKCFVAASRLLFGYKECPKTLDNKMYLWVSYRCNGGGTDATTVTKQAGFSKCDSSEKEKPEVKEPKSSTADKGEEKGKKKKCRKGKKGRKCRKEKRKQAKEKKNDKKKTEKGTGNEILTLTENNYLIIQTF